MSTSVMKCRRLCLASLAVVVGLPIATAAEGDGLGSSISSGKTSISVRYRYEHVDDDTLAQDADASTVRLRLNYRTGKWRGWSGFAELDYIGELFLNDFNSGGGTSSPDRNRFSTVADPKGTDLNQLYFDYEGFSDTRLRIGRQRILLDDQRFVGGVGWRQNEQTYDAVSGIYSGLPRTELFYSYVTRVNRIFGERSPAGRHDNDTHLLNGKISINDNWSITPYYYFIDNNDAAAFSNSTIGVSASGDVKLGKTSLKVQGAVASQSDAANNPINYSAGYYQLSADWILENNLSLGVGLEFLDGDQNNLGQAFRTPLATLHLFQGWADQFLTTPDAGIDDRYITLKYKYSNWSFQGTYHDFSAADGAANWGDELDLSASRKLGERYALLLKAANFNAGDAPFVDTRKIWIQLIANY